MHGVFRPIPTTLAPKDHVEWQYFRLHRFDRLQAWAWQIEPSFASLRPLQRHCGFFIDAIAQLDQQALRGRNVDFDSAMRPVRRAFDMPRMDLAGLVIPEACGLPPAGILQGSGEGAFPIKIDDENEPPAVLDEAMMHPAKIAISAMKMQCDKRWAGDFQSLLQGL